MIYKSQNSIRIRKAGEHNLQDISLDIPAETASVAPLEMSFQAPVAAAIDTLAEDNPEVATKLELAHAYEEMGDKEGARELLQEVINEGDAAQQASARTKLAQLA